MPTMPEDLTRESVGAAIADRIKLRLDQHGWSQRELSRRSGVSQVMISHILSGDRLPTIVIAAKIAAALGDSLDELIPVLALSA